MILSSFAGDGEVSECLPQDSNGILGPNLFISDILVVMKVFGLLVLTIGLGGGELSPQAENIKQSIDSINLTETSTVDLRPLYKAMDELPNLEERRELRKHMSERAEQVKKKIDINVDLTTLPYLYSTGRSQLLIKSIVSVDDLEERRILWRHFAKKLTPIQFPGLSYFSQNALIMAIHNTMHQAVDYLLSKPKEMGGDCLMAFEFNIELLKWYKRLAIHYDSILHGRKKEIHQDGINSGKPNAPTCGDLRITVEDCYWAAVSSYVHELFVMERRFQGLTGNRKITSDELTIIRQRIETFLQRKIRTQKELDDWSLKNYQDRNFPSKELMLQILNQSATK